MPRPRGRMEKITLPVNGCSHEIAAEPSTRLIFILRNRLGLTGAKLGCGLEQCGACAVLVDGEPVLSCVRAVSEFAGSEIVTVEGLARGGPGPVQRAFIEEGAAQCGYCRSEEHTSELQSLMRISYAVFCLKKHIKIIEHTHY